MRASGAELTRSAADQTRYRELVKDDAVSNQVVERADADLTKAHAAVDRSSAALIAAQRQIAVLDAQIGDAEARIATAQAAQRVAALNVEYTTIRSPIDGYVGNRTARVGLLANTGVSLLTVVPSSGLWIDANFKEDQLKKMRVGDECRRRSRRIEQADSRRGGEPRAGHRRDLQRAARGKRHRQLHEDRAARAGARARSMCRRTCKACCAPACPQR